MRQKVVKAALGLSLVLALVAPVQSPGTSEDTVPVVRTLAALGSGPKSTTPLEPTPTPGLVASAS